MLLKSSLENIMKDIVLQYLGSENPSISDSIVLSETRKEFEGQFTLVVFPLVKVMKQSPEQIADYLGNQLLDRSDMVKSFNVVKGFLNLSIKDSKLIEQMDEIIGEDSFWNLPPNGRKLMVEYCSPNTNKPLHLGHIRNMLLGWSVYKIMQASGYEVIRTQVVNDRGIAICKSMLAWQLFSGGETPQSSGIKPDHFVGKYYVMFEQKFKEEYEVWQATQEAQTILIQKNTRNLEKDIFFKDYKNSYFNLHSKLGGMAREMLLHWEEGEKDVLALWNRMNQWVYDGFEETFQKLGIEFDVNYYESDTYLLGKSIVEEGVNKGFFYREEDGAVWIDLEPAGLDKKVLLRSDGTSVYITQDIGTAEQRYKEYGITDMVYVVADEQNYHFQALFETLKRMGVPYGVGLHHLSYGMVELPSGRMKSREGTVVDADDLIAEVIIEAKSMASERGELDQLDSAEKQAIIETIGLGALKYFMIKVHPKKKMLFDPKESLDMQGHTGPYIQNAYVRIMSILRKVEGAAAADAIDYRNLDLLPVEKELLMLLFQYRDVLHKAATGFDPSEIANYCYILAKTFHKFYHDCPILSAELATQRAFRLRLARLVADALRHNMQLLGIGMPSRM